MTDQPQTALDDGGPFHPIPENRDPVTGMGICEGWRGASLRDAIAIAAIPSILKEYFERGADHHVNNREANAKFVAEAAYRVADAMLRARIKHEADGGAL